MRTPAGLGKKGRAMWKWLNDQFEGLDDVYPLAVELCVLADRLHQVRESIEEQGVWIDGGKNPLVDVEQKCSASFARVWRLLGLADKPEAERRAPGRPSTYDA